MTTTATGPTNTNRTCATQPGEHLITYQFDKVGGFWVVGSGDEHFVSTGLERARAHALAIFGYCKDCDNGDNDGNIVVEPVLDELFAEARQATAEDREAAVAKLVDEIYRTETPIGVHDIAKVAECEPDLVRRLFDERCAEAEAIENAHG